MLQNVLESTALAVQYSAERPHYKNMIENLPAAVYTCDSDGYITYYNKAAEELWGRAPVIGKDLWCGSWKIFKADGSPVPLDTCPMAVALKEKRAVHGEEIVVERPDGSRYNIRPFPQPLYNETGEMIGAMNMLMDITGYKKDQQTEAAAEVERKVKERTFDLKSKNAELKRSNDELTSFSYIASHDLQEPLRKITTFSDKLRLQFSENIPQEGKEYLDRIINSSGRMKQLIEDVLNFSRVSSLGEQFVSTNLNDVVKNVLADFDQRMLEKKATVKVGELPVISAIPVQMRQLFFNLIGNALKFSSQTSAPEIELSSRILGKDEVKKYSHLKKRTSYCEIVIKDNGIGFHQENAEKIFNIFQRLHGRSEYSGTGIGLALCRKIADNHNGIIYAQAREQKGAVFFIVLPLNSQ